MKRFWLVLLALGLVMAFSVSVFAADVKFSGSFTAAGMYQDKTTLRKGGSGEGPSTAFYYQQLRVNMEFIATPALKLVTRFDALERVWGGPRSIPGTALEPGSSGTRAENENIAFDNAYIYYVSPIGLFTVGIQDDGAWGTVFANSTASVPKITYTLVKMPFVAGVQMGKSEENSYTNYNASTTADRDYDFYVGLAQFYFTGGVVGFLGKYYKSRVNRTAAVPFKTDLYAAVPYVKAKIGPVAVEAEFTYLWGKKFDFEDATTDVKLSNMTAYIDALADFGMFYAGATGAYVSGDKPETDKNEGGTANGGADWNPCLIMWNWDRAFWAGTLVGYESDITGNNSNDGVMDNAWFGQIRAGVRPIAVLDIQASLAYAKADKAPVGFEDKEYGIELDVTATYKITNNLSYMLGVGYLWTGDYYKGVNADRTNEIDDNYLVLNKLTLTF